MASPGQNQPGGPSTAQPLTPPAEPSSNTTNNNAANTASQPPAGTSNPNNTTTAANAISQPTQIPSTSLTDSGKSRRPRDVRLIHMLLASLGVTAYQERVPLQLLDFAYRYTSSVLQDSVHLATEGYAGAAGEASGTSGSRGGASETNNVSLPALRLSIASRLHYQFQTGLPKEFLMDVATERNRVALPGASRGFDNGANASRAQAHQSAMMGGMRLPPERFCLTGVGWNMKDEWDSDGEEEIEEPTHEDKTGITSGAGAEEGDGGDDDDGDGKMEDIFGDDTAMGEGDGDGDGDKDMTDV
ncbi:hypothetical protein ASPWEDRAFT_51195 [Aspergillus wentii DTO 134E9]|uniref:Transcription initiation factor TFIID subunit 9 n=1 Tax=Aspergillus wentii DTO 134E9 TaxID=1073089 RepID=A0A1L9RJ71_ASPWE|nr:uncharacterized protein ASPWEDRAFT_51195 [Aspergillus wentii DTO 134E9]KAI9932066.1 Transcription initiation factor TFIID subunit 9 [Aspergillus wentii]OJJ34979.1 hypothetical protein ASPWEDRAFT_51195 [Aspergillus wentii DTO 134E9]